MPTSLQQRPAWSALVAHHTKIAPLHLRDLFAKDPSRGERLTLETAGIFFDFSKNRATDETIALLVQLAAESGLRERIDAMFRGDRINLTENRAVLHVALRAPRGASILVDGENVVPHVHAVLDRMTDFSNRVRSGGWKGLSLARSSSAACDSRRWRRKAIMRDVTVRFAKGIARYRTTEPSPMASLARRASYRAGLR